ncbi:MAG: carboxypeptidase regulatory-like domain-containing protein [Candidatus Sumerlaeia bacterium]|nr:carboxypeptidase regulatory-like domain-containing protein [Candidatus Sumerlaeia bacterium]
MSSAKVLAAGLAAVLAVVLVLMLLRPSGNGAGSGPVASDAVPDLATPAASDAPDEAVVPTATPAAEVAVSATAPVGEVAAATARQRWNGSVLAAANRLPVAGVRVSVSLSSTTSDGLRWSGRPVALAETETNADGRWAIDAPVPRDEEQLLFLFEAEGFAGRAGFVMAPDGLRGGFPDVELLAGGTIRGRVVDEGDSPIAGAGIGGMIRVGDQAAAMGRSVMWLHAAWADSDAAGEFAMAGAVQGTVLPVAAWKRGYASGMSEPVAADASGVVIVLRHGGTLAARVEEHDGQPVRDARVTLNLMADGAQRTVRGHHAAVADADGRFTIEDAAAGSWDVVATTGVRIGRSMHAPRRVSARVAVEAGERTEVVLRFDAPAIVTGRAFDEETGLGLPGVRLADLQFQTLSATMPTVETRGAAPPVVTGPDGSFRIAIHTPFMASGLNLFYQAPEGWVRSGRAAREGNETVQPGGAVLDLAFRRGVLVEGVVLDGEGRAVANATVEAGGSDRRLRGGVFTRTGPDGRFVLTIAPGVVVHLFADAPAGWAEQRVEVPEEDALESVTLTLEAHASVAGVVRGPNGSAVAGASVELRRGAPHADAMPRTARTTTGGDGYYFIERLAAGDYDASARGPRGGPYIDAPAEQVALRSGEHREPMDFTLAAGEFIRGVVRTREGEPIAGARVEWMIMAREFTQDVVTTGPDGTFRIVGLTAGVVVNQVTVQHPDFRPAARQNITMLDGDLEFVLDRRGGVTLVVVDGASGAPVPHFAYLLSRDAWSVGPAAWNRTSTVVRDASGRAALTVQGTGGQRVEVIELDDAGGFTGRRGASLFTAGGTQTEVVVKLDGGRTIRGVVVHADSGDPVEDAVVAIAIDGMRPGMIVPGRGALHEGFTYPTARTNRRGAFEMTGLAVGTYRLTAGKEDLVPVAMAEVVIEPEGEPAEATIRMARMAAIFGAVRNSEGDPIVGAAINVADMTYTRQQRVLTDAQGQYRAERMEPGDYRVELSVENSPEMSEVRQASVTAGEDTEVNFDFSSAVRVRGRVFVDGAPWTAGMTGMQFLPATGAEGHPAAAVRFAGVGRYEALLRPGRWVLAARAEGIPPAYMGCTESIVVAADLAEQTFDFDFTTTSADVVIEFPEGTPFVDGTAMLYQHVDGAEAIDRPRGIRMDERRRHVPRLLAGTWTARYTSRDQLHEAATEPTRIGPGEENVFVLFAEPARSDRAQLADVQRRLQALGFEPGPIDGLMGPMTANAVRQFQTAHGLPVTGQPDEATVAKLRELKP